MQTSLLTTKFYFPTTRPSLVRRPRLVQRLQAGLRGPLTLISAPAGSGKTTLVSEWRDGPGAGMPVAWLSLDQADNDTSLFFQYLAACLEALQPGLLEKILPRLQSSELPPGEALMTILVNDISSLTQDAVLVLDDYHVIENSSLHQALAFLLEHLPPQLHLVLLTRADPSLPLARLRARGDLAEIRLEHLRFSLDETDQFLNQVMKLALTRDQISALERRSEGWIAGLQLAALSLQDQPDPDHFVSAFTGSHHYLFDYLAEEVLNHLQPDFKTFLSETALLDRMNASLCNAVTGRQDGQAMLEKLEQNNLFLIPLDNERGWFRYHHLFADQLRARLRHLDPGRIPELLRRASGWYAREGFLEAAISYSLQAEDFKRAVVLIEQYAPTMTSQGRVGTLAAWNSTLPEQSLAGHPRLGLALVWALYLKYQFDECEARLQKVEQKLSPEDELQIRGELALWHGIIARRHSNLEQSRIFLCQALEQLPPENPALLGRAHIFLGMTWLESDANEAHKQFIQARDAFAGDKNIHGELAALYFLAWTERLQGALVRAWLTCEHAMHLAEQVPDWPVASYAHLATAELLYERNELEQAAVQVKKASELAETGGHTDNLVIASLDAARIKRASRDWEGAQKLLEHTSDMAADPIIIMVKVQLNLEQVRLFLAQGKTPQAYEWWQQNHASLPSGTFFSYALDQIIQARLLLARQETHAAGALLAALLEPVENAGMGQLAMQINCLQALALKGQGQKDAALESLQRAISAAKKEGNLRPFLDEGISILDLLHLAKNRGISQEFTAHLLEVIPSEEPDKPARSASPGPLSKREIELLRLVADGCSNKEIATALVISVGTVKRHTVNIFNKLDVKNRTEAAARARELGLL